MTIESFCEMIAYRRETFVQLLAVGLLLVFVQVVFSSSAVRSLQMAAAATTLAGLRIFLERLR